MYSEIVTFIRKLYKTEGNIPLHVPVFNGNEKKYLNDCIDSTFVSSVGKYVSQFENLVAEYTGSNYAIATMNGTSALHIALLLADVKAGDEVITQPLTFIATVNAISYCKAEPIFLDVDKDTLGLSPEALMSFLEKRAFIKNKTCYNSDSGKVIRACVPMHTFGHPCRIDKIKEICDQFHITLVEDAAESLGSYYKNKHTGTFGMMGILSFNGNKILTTGGGGMIITDNENVARRAKHITTTAKVPHPWEFIHDETGYNYRLTNLAAALGCAQIEQLPVFLKIKREIAGKYEAFFSNSLFTFVKEPSFSKSNYWLNTILLENLDERNRFLSFSNEKGVMTRPVWKLMNTLKMYENCFLDELTNAKWIEERAVNIPSSVIL